MKREEIKRLMETQHIDPKIIVKMERIMKSLKIDDTLRKLVFRTAYNLGYRDGKQDAEIESFERSDKICREFGI